MIVTHTRNANGDCRIYLGGKGSLECWIEPKPDKRAWCFHIDEAVAGNQLSDDGKRAWAIHTLIQLAEALDVSPQDLAGVPFEAIAALHCQDPFEGRRRATPRRKVMDHAFMASAPGIARPRADYAAMGDEPRRRQGR